MKTITCSSKTLFGFRIHKTTPQTPLVPILGGGRHPLRHTTEAAALSFQQYSGQPQGPFSFIQPDVPADAKQAEKPRPVLPESFMNKPTEVEDFQESAAGKPRFRSALEQVSYYTNESAMRRKWYSICVLLAMEKKKKFKEWILNPIWDKFSILVAAVFFNYLLFHAYIHMYNHLCSEIFNFVRFHCQLSRLCIITHVFLQLFARILIYSLNWISADLFCLYMFNQYVWYSIEEIFLLVWDCV